MKELISRTTSLRTHSCGALRIDDAGSPVRLGGWVHRMRDLGGLIFIDLRDRDGLIQVSFDPARCDAEACRTAASAGVESVVLIEGDVVARPAEMRNDELATGDVEVRGRTISIVGPATTPTIPVALGRGEKLASEELRLRHRYLDLRRPELQKNLILRHHLLQATRSYLSGEGFLEVETPVLTRPTPEGARDYLVPSRVHPGEFYALPQSPQLYKQLLMVAGFDRYFQIARCFRDEDLRADRQPEFSQIDIEASFVTSDDIFSLAEGMLSAIWAAAGVQVTAPFLRLAYSEAFERFGTDRPDLRYGLELFDASSVFRGAEFGITSGALGRGERIRGMRIPGGAALSRKQVDELEAVARDAGLAGLLRIRRMNGVLEGPPVKFLDEAACERLGLAEGELALLAAAPDRVANPALDRVRQAVAAKMGIIDPNTASFLWVTDFPLFARDEATGSLVSEHHPFTAPHPDDMELLDSDPAAVRSLAYDAVYNGNELASGSIRIGDPRLQERIFGLLGIDEQAARARFGFLLEGLRAGAPPHGGIAFGFDRIAMLLAGASSLRDVIAFPKTTAARALFEGAPVRVPAADLAALQIRTMENS